MPRVLRRHASAYRDRAGALRQPRLIIADEPTTALDVSIQAQIIALLKKLCRDHGTAVMLITHDMGVIAEAADRVAVMYAGRLAEIGPVREVIKRPKHPYTVGLMASIPVIGGERGRLRQIDGAMPRLSEIPAGCAFAPRCPHAFDRCRLERPALLPAGSVRTACWLMPGRRRGRMPEAPLVRVRGLARHFDVSQPFLARVLRGRGGGA